VGAGANPPELTAADDDVGLAVEAEAVVVATRALSPPPPLVVTVLLLLPTVPTLVEEGTLSFNRVLTCHR